MRRTFAFWTELPADCAPQIPKNVTHLTRTPRNEVAPTTKKLVAKLPRLALPQTCVLHPLPASAYRTALLLPSFLSDLEQRCLVNELNDALFDGQLAHEHLRTALTSPSAAVGGTDYNRLELLGDSVRPAQSRRANLERCSPSSGDRS